MFAMEQYIILPYIYILRIGTSTYLYIYIYICIVTVPSFTQLKRSTIELTPGEVIDAQHRLHQGPTAGL